MAVGDGVAGLRGFGGGERGELAAEERGERGLEGGAVGELVLQGEDDEAELGHGALLGLEVDGLGVEEGLAGGDDEQAAAQDVRALLVPEGELAGELGVLVDAGFDLLRAVDEAGLGEVVDDGGAVVGAVAAAGDPADEVVAVGGGEGEDLDELFGGAAGELHEDEVGLHGHGRSGCRRRRCRFRWRRSRGLRG